MKSLSLILLILLFVTSCTRKASENSKISISLPTVSNSSKGVGSLSGSEELFVLFININYDGIKIAEEFEFEGATNPQTSFEFIVPNGANRLVQVLGVYKNTTTGSLVFRYGDAMADLTGGNIAVDVIINQVGGGSHGKASGRYRLGDNSLYTGPVKGYISPVADKPAMLIFEEKMVAGWFDEFIILDSLPITYILEDIGQLMWQEEVSLSSAVFSDPEGQEKLAMFQPSSLLYSDKGVEPAEPNFIGWWKGNGFDTGSLFTCLSPTGVDIDGRYTDSELTTAARWPDDYSQVGFGGCGTAAFSDEIEVSGSRLNSDSAIGLRAPFISVGSAGTPAREKYFNFTRTSSDSFTWAWLPGLTGHIDGFKIYQNSNTQHSTAEALLENDEDPIDCASVPGFSYLATVDTSIMSYNLGAAETVGDKSSFLFCPYRGNENIDELVLYTGCVTGQHECKTLELTIPAGNSFDYGTLAAGASSLQSFTIENNTGEMVSSIGSSLSGDAAFTFAGGSYPGTGGDCTTSLAPGTSCTVNIEFNPSSAGSKSGNLDMSFSADGAAYNQTLLNLSGMAESPANLSISDSDPYDFGSVAPSTVVGHTFTLTNNGGVSATGISGSGLAAPFRFKGGSYPGTGGTCGPSLAAGSSCEIKVEFAPTVGGFADDTIVIDYNNGASSLNVTRGVRGTGGV